MIARVLQKRAGAHPEAGLRAQVVMVQGKRRSPNSLQGLAACKHLLFADAAAVVFDMSDVPKIGAPELAALLACVRHAEEEGGLIKFCGMRPSVRRVFQRVRFHRLVEVFNSRAEALASLA